MWFKLFSSGYVPRFSIEVLCGLKVGQDNRRVRHADGSNGGVGFLPVAVLPVPACLCEYGRGCRSPAQTTRVVKACVSPRAMLLIHATATSYCHMRTCYCHLLLPHATAATQAAAGGVARAAPDTGGRAAAGAAAAHA